MPSLFCCCRNFAALAHSDSVEVAGSTPMARSPTLPSSCGSLIIPALPAYFLSNRRPTLVPGSGMTEELYPIAVQPDCHAIVYLLPRSQDGFLMSGPAYLWKLVIIDWSSGVSQPNSIR